MRFTKMHGIGNDYVYVNGFVEKVSDPAKLAIAVSDRHTAIGSDGLILVLPSEVADVRMRMFNADGSEAEMCGNGVRCVAKYAYDHGLTRANPMRVQTGNGVLTLALDIAAGKVQHVTVNMGQPVLELAKIPVDAQYASPTSRENVYTLRMGNAGMSHAGAQSRRDEAGRPQASSGAGSPKLDESAHGYELTATFVSMGNPHAVIFVDDVAAIDLALIGPQVEHHQAFPRRINAHWVQIISDNEVIMRTWERGSGITLACGTGACAVAVASALTGRTGRQVLAHLPGGDLLLEWGESDNCVYMTGPAVEVFEGVWPE